MDESPLMQAAQRGLKARLSAASTPLEAVASRLLSISDNDPTAALLRVLLTRLDRCKSPDQPSPLHRFGLHGYNERRSSPSDEVLAGCIGAFAAATTVQLFLYVLENEVGAHPDDSSQCDLALAVFEAAEGVDKFGLGSDFVAFVRRDREAVHSAAISPFQGEE